MRGTTGDGGYLGGGAVEMTEPVKHVCQCASDGSLSRLFQIAEERGWPYTDFPLPRDFVAENLPAAARLIVLRIDGHPSAVIHGAIHDTFDSSEGGRALIVGYWTLEV